MMPVMAIWVPIHWMTGGRNKQLAKSRSYLDIDKVGIWGHSGGGFATADAMFTDFIRLVFLNRGNQDNRNYEDDWGERYIGLETRAPVEEPL
jgi:hypothetical protein